MVHKPYLVHLGLGSLLESVQNNLQVFLELSTDGESDVSKRRQDLGLHRPVDVLILHRQTHKKKIVVCITMARVEANAVNIQTESAK